MEQTVPKQTDAQVAAEYHEAMAAWLRRHPDVPVPEYYSVSMTVFYREGSGAKDEARRVARAMGKGRKSYIGTYFELKYEIAPSVWYEWNTDREYVCAARVTGERVVEVPAQPAVPATTKIVPIIEYECGVILDNEAEQTAAPIP